MQKWRILFETGDLMITEDSTLAQLHSDKGRLVEPLDYQCPLNMLGSGSVDGPIDSGCA
jgi:hypothetical protein